MATYPVLRINSYQPLSSFQTNSIIGGGSQRVTVRPTPEICLKAHSGQSH